MVQNLESNPTPVMDDELKKKFAKSECMLLFFFLS